MKSNKVYKQGFTLIELLVVISIVSMLSSVVYASLNGARDKATLAAGQQFAASQYHAQGADIVDILNFDDSSLGDSSGLGNTPNVTTGSVIYSSDTYNNRGKSIYFNGSTHLTIPNVGNPSLNPKGFSYSLWVKPTVFQNGTSFVIGKDSLFSCISGSQMCLTEYTGGTNIFTFGQSNLISKWSQLTVTVDANKNLKIYINSKLVREIALNPQNFNLGNDVMIGGSTDNPLILGFIGYMDDIKIYNYTLTTSQIEKNYAQDISDQSFAQNQINQQ